MEEHKDAFVVELDIPTAWAAFYPAAFGLLILWSTMLTSDAELEWHIQLTGVCVFLVTPLPGCLLSGASGWRSLLISH
jgi:hypothetical protein